MKPDPDRGSRHGLYPGAVIPGSRIATDEFAEFPARRDIVEEKFFVRRLDDVGPLFRRQFTFDDESYI